MIFNVDYIIFCMELDELLEEGYSFRDALFLLTIKYGNKTDI